MLEIASKPIHIFLDFNSVIVNLPSLSPDNQADCLDRIEQNVNILKTYLEENISLKEHLPEIPETGMAVLQQQFILAQAIESWIASLRHTLPESSVHTVLQSRKS